MFVHEKYADKKLPRMAGWWGHNEQDRFMMKKGFKAMPGAEGWQLSNAPILSMAAYKASVNIFAEAGMARLAGNGRPRPAVGEAIRSRASGARRGQRGRIEMADALASVRGGLSGDGIGDDRSAR